MEIKTDRDFVQQLEITELAQAKYEAIKQQQKENIIEKLNNEGIYIKIDGVKYFHEKFIKKLLGI
jgi:hypothetical protein